MRVMLEKIRLAQELRLEDIAAELDVAISTVQRWEAQTMNIPSGRLPAIAEAYGCRISDIFEDDRPSDRENVSAIISRMSASKRAQALRILRTFADEDDAASGA